MTFGYTQAVARGFGEGVAGVFLKPVQGAQKEGAAGFFKGLAQGVVGVAVKPVVGVLDGATTLVQGVGDAVSGERPPEAQRLAPPLKLAPLADSDELALEGAEGLVR